MKKRKLGRKLLSLLLTLALVLVLMPGMGLKAYAATDTMLTLNVEENGKVVMSSGIYGNGDGNDAGSLLEVTSNWDNRGTMNVADGYCINVHEGANLNILNPGKILFYPAADNTGTITAVPDDGYTFTGWYNGETLYSGAAELDYKNISEELTLTAKFEAAALHTHDSITFTAWDGTTSLPTAAGNYYLTQDVTLSSHWTVPGTTNLCLNGHTITGPSNEGAIYVEGSATLNLYDEAANAGKITHANEGYGWGVYIKTGGTFNMYGGSITGNRASDGGGVYIDYGTFNMYGGSITGNTATSYYGGGVHIYLKTDGTTNTFNMYGGSITGNTAAMNGGGVYNDGAFTMYGGSIAGNTSDSNGGGVCNGAYGTFTLRGGSITGNTANTMGGGVFISTDEFNLAGNPTISGNVQGGTINGGTLTGGTADNVHLADSKINIIDELTYTHPIGVKMSKYKDYYGFVPNPGVFTDGWTTNMSGKTPTDYFTSDNSAYYIAVEENELKLETLPAVSYQAASWDSANNKVNYTTESCDSYTVVTSSTTSFEDGKWYVVKDTVESVNSYVITVTGTANLILCDGATLKTDGVTVSSGNTLNIYGQSAGTGKLIASSGTDAGIGGTLELDGNWDAIPSAGICGTINIHGGTVEARSNDGAAIGGYDGFAGGEVTIYGGTVTAWSSAGGAGIGGGGDNTSVNTNSGGAGGTVTIYGGTVNATGGTGIGGGTSSFGTGGDGGTVTIYGGTVNATGHSGYGGTGIGGGGQLYGGGEGGSGGTVAIYGGTVKTSGDSVGIGGGKDNGSHGTLTIGTGLYLYGGTSANPETDLSNHVAQSNGDYARSQYMTVNNVAPHTHSFTYSASGATITATCDGTGACDITDGLELTIIAPTGSLVYDGTTTYPATLSTGYSTTAFPDTYTISYTKDGSAYNGLPKDAGAYTASITVGTGDAAKTASVNFTIAKGNVATVTEAPTAKNLTYNGSAQELVTAGTATGGTMQYAIGTDASTAPTSGWGASIPAKTDAGTYYVWYIVKGDEDHNDLQAVCVETSIAKAPGAQAVPAHMYFEVPSDDYSSFNLAISCHSDEYHLNLVEDQEYVLVNKGAEPDWSKAQELDEQHGAILYTGLGAATEYDIWSRTKETANTLPGEPALFRYTTGIFGLGLNEEALVGNTLTVITDPERIEGLTWQWFYADEDEDGIIVRGEAITNATSSSYTVKEADLGKYLWYEMYKGGNRLESGNTDPVKIGINPTVTLEGWAYGDTPNTPVVTGNTGNGEVTFEYAIKGSDVPSTENIPVFPGTYTVYAYIEGSGDYAYGFAEADFVITEGTAATYKIVGNVTVPTGDGATTYNNVPDADVELRQGNIIFAAAKTDENGRYSFTSVPNGEYNIVVTGNINSSGADDSGNGSGESDGTATTKTEYVRVADSDQTIDIVMPFYNVSSMVNVKGKTPAAVVAGLDDAAAGSLTDAEKTGGVTTTMTMEIESTGDLTDVPETQLTDEQKKTKTEQEKIKEANGNLGNDASENLEFLDMSIYRKTQKEGESAQIESVHDLNTVLEILLPYDTLNRLFRIFRYHGTVATAFRQLSERPKSGFTDGTFYVGSGFVALYGNGFSTYAIGYTEKPAENQGGSSYVPYVPSTPATITYTIIFDANGGTGSMSSKQYSGATKLPANTFTRSGYTFAGWSTKADGTGVSYEDKDDISPSTDITLYAQWKAVEAATPTPEPVPATVDTVTKEEKAQGKIDINSAFKVYQSGKKVVAEWGEVEDADLYEVYATYCGGTYSLIKTVTDGSLTCSFKKLDGVKIDFSKNFKVYVAAYRTIDGEKKLIAKTIKAHVVGSENKKRTNASSIELEKSKYSVKVGNTFEIKATTILVDPKKKQLSNAHAAEFRYLSTDTSIAKVSKDGTVTGISKGTCYIWVYSRNGLGVKVKVTVK